MFPSALLVSPRSQLELKAGPLLLLQLHAICHPPRWDHACVKNTNPRAGFDLTGHDPTPITRCGTALAADTI
jgi:hypothetical protein